MNRYFALLAAIVLSGCAAMTHDSPTASASSPRELKMAFDITDTSPAPLIVKLETIETTRKQLIDKGITPRIVLTFRGNASYYTQTDLNMVKEADRADALRIRSLIKQLRAASGVESVEQCNIPLASRKIKPGDLMPEVKLVPNGWIALVEYQHKGYAYIAP
jgi:intracellular sulfur oxidation DsrE/DsrF family protein